MQNLSAFQQVGNEENKLLISKKKIHSTAAIMFPGSIWSATATAEFHVLRYRRAMNEHLEQQMLLDKARVTIEVDVLVLIWDLFSWRWDNACG